MPAWQEVLGPVKHADFFQQLMARIDAERAAGKAIYPPASEVFNALTLTPLDDVKVVILGQDPYHGPGQAHGLCFSVQPGVKTPPSLVNIYKELAQDIEGFHVPEHGNLTAWAEQGVLLLNTVLTVEQGKAHSHAKWGWETFTDAVIKSVNDTQQGVVFLLWGSHAQKKGQNIDTQKHYVLNAPHPSPLSAHRGFLGCRHFSQTNTLLSQQGKTPVNWQV
ncbi:MAG: uracil-DNA glycosylase [Aestuariibacter sp.]|nr:uracil-DNA glycosylase [Aestuariibacter sp.]MCP4524367.1 uracil-DNA glycosylase [Aestuariibacter sp.]MCP4946624.1 uracil-DNA glycosylase [Aestuariibacter sp.]